LVQSDYFLRSSLSHCNYRGSFGPGCAENYFSVPRTLEQRGPSVEGKLHQRDFASQGLPLSPLVKLSHRRFDWSGTGASWKPKREGPDPSITNYEACLTDKELPQAKRLKGRFQAGRA
jgi:hypothetical protein